MFNKLTSRLLLVVSLFLLSAAQPVFSADKAIEPVTAMQMVEKIDINSATAEQLATIKGIGMKKAQAIVDYRLASGDLTSLDQLLNVKGIGPGILKKIEPFLVL